MAPISQYGAWPTDEHALLLQAALRDAAHALPAWSAWQARCDLDAVDAGSLRLLPLVYRNLTRLGVSAESLGRVRGVHRQTWYRNQLIIGHLADLVRELSAAGVETLVLKGIPLAMTYYKEVAVRPMADADLLVPATRAADAFRIVTAAGWTPQDSPVEWPPRFTGSRSFSNALGLEVDLHCHVMHECLQADADDDFWEAARPLEVGHVATRALAPADQLLHVIVHGFRRSTVPPVRWVADAVTVIRESGADLDWQRFLLQARRRRLSRIAASTLGYLSQTFGPTIPRDIIEALESTPRSVTERLDYWSRVQPGTVQLGVEAWCEYQRAIGREPQWSGPFGFVHYIKDRLGVRRLRELPSAAAAKMSPRRFEAAMMRATQK